MRRLLRWLLRLFPAGFQQTFGSDLMSTFEERWEESGGLRLALRTVTDIMRSAVLEHLAEMRRRRAGRSTQVHRKGDNFMKSLAQDLRFALRMLLKNPGFTIVAAIVLALGIGANSAVFSLLDQALLRPLPFDHPQQLAVLWEHPPGYAHNRVSPLNFLDWSEQNQTFVSMAAVSGGNRVLTSQSGGAEQIRGQSVSAKFFEVMGVSPVAGRFFNAEDVTDKASTVVLSEGFWRSRFGADPKLVGGMLRLDGEPFTVIGIAPAGFQLFYKSDLWTSFGVRRSPEFRRMHYLQVVARLKPGATLDQARNDMNLVAANIARISPSTNKNWTVTVEPIHETLVGGELRTTSLVLAGTAGFVLLMACANLANLLLARGAGRSRELAVRASLGGSRTRILRQLLTESALLAAVGGTAGVALGWLILRLAPRFIPPGLLPVEMRLALDGRILAFAAALTGVTGLLFGLGPAWHAARVSLADALRAGGRAVSGGTGKFRTVLAAAEVAIAVLLLAGAGLLLRTLGSLRAVDPGYRASNVLTMYVMLPLSRYPGQDKALAFYQAARREIASLPGVRQVGLGGSLPLDGWDIGQGFEIIGHPSKDEANRPSAHYQIVGASYFDALGIPLLRGRPFTDHDTAEASPVCIVNEEFAHRYLQGGDPIGARVKVAAMAAGGPTYVVREVVGVSHQVKVEGPGEKQNNLEIYVPITQNPWYDASIAIRTAGDPMALAPAVKAAIARVDKDEPVTRVRTMDDVAAESMSQPRFRAELVGMFAALALVLAAVGIFGVLAFSVSQRTREFGIRIALGAGSGDVVRLVLRGGLQIVAAGIAAGLLAAMALTRWLESLLFGVQPLDLPTFLAAPLFLALVALLACAAPALRAARVDPAVSLRQE